MDAVEDERVSVAQVTGEGFDFRWFGTKRRMKAEGGRMRGYLLDSHSERRTSIMCSSMYGLFRNSDPRWLP